MENFPANQDHIDQQESESSTRKSGIIKSIKNNLGKTAAIGATFLMASAGELEPPRETSDQIRERAKHELATNGITTDQEKAYIAGVNDLIQRGVTPFGYWSTSADGKVSFSDVYERLKDNLHPRSGMLDDFPSKEDAWRLYLGMPQINNTFSISDYQPETRKEEKYYYKINNVVQEFIGYEHKKISDQIKEICDYFKEHPHEKVYHSIGAIMGNMSWSHGEDSKGKYISYYDRWKIDVPPENKKGFFGKPFEIYDRIYYDPQTFEIIK